MREVHQASAWLADDDRIGDWNGHVFNTRITAWWLFYTAWVIFGWMSITFGRDGGVTGSPLESVFFEMLRNVSGIVAVIIAIRIVSIISKQQEVAVIRTEEEFLLG